MPVLTTLLVAHSRAEESQVYPVVRVVNAATGELFRDLILDPSRDYQPTGAPKGPTRRPPK